MIDKIIGFGWGFIIAFLSFDYISDDIDIKWWAWAMLFTFMTIVNLCLSIYSFITDYKAMAETGWSVGKKIYMWTSNKWKNQYVSKSTD